MAAWKHMRRSALEPLCRSVRNLPNVIAVRNEGEAVGWVWIDKRENMRVSRVAVFKPGAPLFPTDEQFARMTGREI